MRAATTGTGMTATATVRTDVFPPAFPGATITVPEVALSAAVAVIQPFIVGRTRLGRPRLH